MSYYYDNDAGGLTKEEFLSWRAAKQYDDRLVLKFNPQGNDYVMYIKTDMTDGMPRLKAVFGFGQGNPCPSPDKVKETLDKADGWKYGDRVLREMDAREAVRKKNNQWLRDEIAGDAAERIEKVMRRDGKSPIIKSMPK